LIGINLNNYYLCAAMIYEREENIFILPTDPEFQKGMGFIFSCTAEHKKCCEKFKKGKRCKKCPANKKKK